MHVFAISVRILAAGQRTYIVDLTIILLIQKSTGTGLQYPIAIFVHAQIGVSERGDLGLQMFGNALNVDGPKNGRCCFAAVGALQAIQALENFIVHTVKLLVQIFSPPQCAEEFFIFFFLLLGNIEVFAQLVIHWGR